MKTILVTGACGMIGRYLTQRLKKGYKLILLDKACRDKEDENTTFIQGSIENHELVRHMLSRYTVDVVLHCAGISGKKNGIPYSDDIYDRINHLASLYLAETAALSNPDVHFLFFSSISVYGNCLRSDSTGEGVECHPDSCYAKSKLNAENGLKKLFSKGKVRKVDILRLAPVYDRKYSLNLDKRVFGPKKMIYLRHGSGQQQMSVLSLKNLVDFVDYRVNTEKKENFCVTLNITDKEPCSFNRMIEIFKKSRYQPQRMTLNIPLKLLWMLNRLGCTVSRQKSEWIRSGYAKIAQDMVVNNEKLLNSGFTPRYSLEKIFNG